MVKKSLKEGVTVQELERFARKYTTEVFSSLAIIVATISAMFDFFIGPGWSIALAGLAAVVGIIIPAHIEKTLKQMYEFVNKQQKTTQIILGVVRIVIALFIPPVIFIAIGLLAGSGYHYYDKQSRTHMKKSSQNKPEGPNEGGPHEGGEV